MDNAIPNHSSALPWMQVTDNANGNRVIAVAITIRCSTLIIFKYALLPQRLSMSPPKPEAKKARPVFGTIAVANGAQLTASAAGLAGRSPAFMPSRGRNIERAKRERIGAMLQQNDIAGTLPPPSASAAIGVRHFA
jgi:hypothetical protein